ncbi:MAG: tetratricopeptide repeat protein [Gammaproteobacteria bacterium]|nr:tetratricopeptide repeat protein [Gammaproteobacteria bacterium]MDH3447420.1 tetratricopeptide repeat protein [Gammaproteobacteria bacterium]
MSIFNNRKVLLLAVLMLAACQSVPEPAPQPEPVTAPEPVVEQAPPPEPVDFNQQFYEEAIGTLKSGKTGLALELLIQVSSDAPDKPFVFTNLGLAYFKLQKMDLAEKAFEEAIKRDDGDAVAHNHLGILQRQKGEFQDARGHYQRAIDADSDYALAYLNLGILFDIYLQDLEQALRHYQKYQSLVGEENAQVAAWIVDIERRLKPATAKSQG